MKKNIKVKISRAKRTRLGRTLCRLTGDQTGAVMMEYVILGVLVAAAATLAVIFFGQQIVGAFSVMRHSTTGDTKGASTAATANQGSLTGQDANAASYNKTVTSQNQ